MYPHNVFLYSKSVIIKYSAITYIVRRTGGET